MKIGFELNLDLFRAGIFLTGVTSFFFGIFTAIAPRASIAFYEWLMALINWRVSPIDEAREVRTTRLLGVLLILLSLMGLGLVLHGWI